MTRVRSPGTYNYGYADAFTAGAIFTNSSQEPLLMKGLRSNERYYC